MERHLMVHGSIFYLLKKFVVHNHSEAVWQQFVTKTGKPPSYEYIITEGYPLSDIESILASASSHTGVPAHKLQEAFGEWLVPDLFKVYSDYLNPEWRTYDVLINTEKVFHRAVRKLNSTAQPPILHISEVNEKFLMIDYYSKRRMSSLAVGIIRGIAKYYNEAHLVDIVPTTEPDAERVQIKVLFQNLTL
jgi:hypothetical protein